jgi:hypothetical protein
MMREDKKWVEEDEVGILSGSIKVAEEVQDDSSKHWRSKVFLSSHPLFSVSTSTQHSEGRRSAAPASWNQRE